MANAYVLVAALGVLVCTSCETGWSQSVPIATRSDRRTLPAPERDGGLALARVLDARRSIRVFAPRALEDRELSQLLWAAQGVTDGHRTVPSAGARYPLTVRVVDGSGVWRYLPAEHAIVRESAATVRDRLRAAAFDQDVVAHAPATIVITGAIAITARKYGTRAQRFVAIEAGHAAQNVLLTATALGLAAVPVGAFDDAALRRALALPADDTPLYLIPVGAPG